MLLRKLSTYNDGADLTLMNVIYQRPTKNEEDGTRNSDYLDIVYKDNTDGKKYHDITDKPDYTFYMLKDDVPTPTYNMLFEEKDKLKPVTVKYNNLIRSIADLTDQRDTYNDNIENQDYGANRLLQKDPRLFNSDQGIEDHYRFEFSKKFQNRIIKVFKGYYDIETDIRDCKDDFPKLGECPVNAISYMDDKTMEFITLLLRNPANPLIEEFENNYVSGKDLNQEIIQEFICNNMDKNVYEEHHIKDIKFKICFYDQEIELIRDFFKAVNNVYIPDFVGGWNSSAFDISYLYARCQVLGYDPNDIMPDQESPKKYTNIYVDERNINMTPNRGDYANIAGSSVWIDYMIQFASRRKNKFSSFGSISLDSIGEMVANIRKLDYHKITKFIGDLPYRDYRTFVLYNIFDVLVLKCIEDKDQDIEYLFNKCIINNTSYNKAHRQTVYLVNRMTKEWDKLGYVIGNNNNRWNEKPEKYLGALVQDPLKTSDYSKQKVNGKPIMVVDNCQDYDFKSLYPSTMLQWNIAPNTQIGRINIPNQVYEDENPFLASKYSRGGDFVESLVTQNIIQFCHRWLHYASIEEFIEDWKEYNKLNKRSFSNYTGYMQYNYYNHQLYNCPIEDIGKDNLSLGVTFSDKGNYKPIHMFMSAKDSGVLDNE